MTITTAPAARRAARECVASARRANRRAIRYARTAREWADDAAIAGQAREDLNVAHAIRTIAMADARAYLADAIAAEALAATL